MVTLDTEAGPVRVNARGLDGGQAKVAIATMPDSFLAEHKVRGAFSVSVSLSMRASDRCDVSCSSAVEMTGRSSGQYFESVSQLTNGVELVIGAPDDDWFVEHQSKERTSANVEVRPCLNGLTVSIAANGDREIEVPFSVVWAAAGDDAAWLAASVLAPSTNGNSNA